MTQTAVQTVPQQTRLCVKLASNSEEIEQAMRLRYRVFVEEEKNMLMLNDNGLEQDEYDVYCDHLIVKDLDNDRIIGTYRLLPGDLAILNKGFYSESEFDLSSFHSYKPQTLELGRSCIDRAYRGGKAIQLLWEGIASYITERNYSYLIGCASVHVPSLNELNVIYSMLCEKQVITDKYGIQPLESHRVRGLQKVESGLSEKEVFRKLPPLMKGYQWLGAEIGGDPAYDSLFDTIDFFIILEKDRVTRRYKKHFLNN
ncbi:GNAT family N-acetyltransferase [Paenibacillus radicis (ex Xue et al. 2023)]|uniref:GNAT family N-acetyltransferase n=1 Tax=Paenibacillus radicis (ex Xue et al. 2023) TaxID=2972489 RepID=A0ABT1YFA9_9BACL|nr:GNAT family N-acyltransferase [Paenibacillus radicis (ex Xue et al. 2023)]MCR8631892.1 GNAT family N-acetyltransferase [Paenibacillus radicis (ex Xue et al. 2023)]